MKRLLLIFTALLLSFVVFPIAAQENNEAAEELMEDVFTAAETSEEEEKEDVLPLAQRFPAIKIHDQFSAYVPVMYYRFSPDVLFFEPIDLSYFPHEKWNKSVWTLLGRWTDGIAYNQILYADPPASGQIMHGTATGESRGILNDFYLYATLFIEDSYPQDTGSCYVYYSDSLMIGLKESKGILIDPESGIYEATNSYGGARHTTYTPNTIKHSLELLQELFPYEYALDPDDYEVESTSIGAAEYPGLAMDEQFLHDFEALRGSFRMKASPAVKAYRVEVIRENGISTIYINGNQVYSDEDHMKTTNANGELVPERVSWSYGPILNDTGVTVTCSLGDFIVAAPVH